MIQKLKDLKYRLHLMQRERTNAQKRRELTKNGIIFGAGTYCDPSSTIMPKVVMGTNCFVNKETLVGAHTTLGNNVFLGPRVTIFADTHEIGSAAQRAGANITRPVHIKKRYVGGAKRCHYRRGYDRQRIRDCRRCCGGARLCASWRVCGRSGAAHP